MPRSGPQRSEDTRSGKAARSAALIHKRQNRQWERSRGHFAPLQPTQKHRLDHRTVALGPQRGKEIISLVRVDDSRQRAWCADQGNTPHGSLTRASHRQPTRDRILLDRSVAADNQILIQARDRGQSTLDRASR